MFKLGEDLVGFVASGSRSSWCYVLLVEGMEDEVKEESLAYIVDRGRRVLGILRSGMGVDENLRVGAYSPGVAYARKGMKPSSSRRSFTYVFSVIGRVEDDGAIRENRLILTPGSPVYLCRENPFENLGGDILYAARHWEKPWKIPFDPAGIPMHILVVGSTGSGKSFLARHVIIPLMREAGYSVLAFDWHGCDYAPYVEKDEKMSMGDVKMDGAAAARFIGAKAMYFGYSTSDNKPYRTLREVMEGSDAWRDQDPKSLPEWIMNEMAAILGEKTWARVAGAVERGLNRLTDEDWKRILGRTEPSEIIEKARKNGLLVVDMGGFGDEEKLSVFLSIAGEVKSRIEKGEEMNLCMIIDEAPQYAGYNAKGTQQYTRDLIRDLAATGRKHRLSLVLISQGLAGEIGVDASVRRNLNTHFIGRILPQDRREVEDMLGAYHINYESLLRLERGQFYFEGRMNPFPTPILISFDI
ncbi:hypothetical protein B6U84_04125 [Candidatus Bathyarchaeota archaeon ex4484_40]|nr:MAG: hypothetical protein B6U84_04125 [Candidatus Bathyarchaeota archaeon ex4484_40]